MALSERLLAVRGWLGSFIPDFLQPILSVRGQDGPNYILVCYIVERLSFGIEQFGLSYDRHNCSYAYIGALNVIFIPVLFYDVKRNILVDSRRGDFFPSPNSWARGPFISAGAETEKTRLPPRAN